MIEFIKGFIKLRDQMCELNYKGTKIEIRVKLGDQIIILPTKNEVFIGNYSDADTWQS